MGTPWISRKGGNLRKGGEVDLEKRGYDPPYQLCEGFLKEFPYFNRKIKVNETDKIKRREEIIYKIVKEIPSDNDMVCYGI